MDNKVVSLIDIGLAIKLLGLLLKERKDLLMTEVLVVSIRSSRDLRNSKHVLPYSRGFRQNF